jgi:AcrR family transcriptional regulator
MAIVRAIAAAVGVDPKLIAYLFGSKQQLFVAAIGLPLNSRGIARNPCGRSDDDR